VAPLFVEDAYQSLGVAFYVARTAVHATRIFLGYIKLTLQHQFRVRRIYVSSEAASSGSAFKECVLADGAIIAFRIACVVAVV
jgi:hypothetical protein